jgi:hypothetical protein
MQQLKKRQRQKLKLDLKIHFLTKPVSEKTRVFFLPIPRLRDYEALAVF